MKIASSRIEHVEKTDRPPDKNRPWREGSMKDLNLNIRDYLVRVNLAARRPNRAGPTAGGLETGRNPFERLLAAGLPGEAASGSRLPEGLTIADYLASPIRPRLPAGHALENGFTRTARLKPQDTPVPRLAAVDSREDVDADRPPPASSAHPSSGAGCLRSLISNNAGPAEQETIAGCIQEAARKYRLAPELITAVIRAESNFNINAVSAAGAQGLMQLMPATAAELGVTDPFDIRQNIDGGARYLRQMLDLFKGDIRRALSAYNAGPGNVQKYGGEVPFPETKHYIARVLRSVGSDG